MYKIALTEDNFLASQTLQQKLADISGVELMIIAENGEDIVNQIINRDDIQLILMDIEMPMLNGIEATRLLKKIKPEIKIIIGTIYDDDENIF